MDPVVAIVSRFKANQTVREFLAETMGTFILMVSFDNFLFVRHCGNASLFASMKKNS